MATFQPYSVEQTQHQAVEINKVLRNTYALLSMTLLFSAAMAGVSMVVQPPAMTGMICSIAALVMLWFVIPRVANSSSSAGLIAVFVTTGLLGFGLGPMLTRYVTVFSNGPELIMMAMGGTAVVFLGLSGYALTSRKDFSFLGAGLMIGILIGFVAAIAAIFLQIPALSLGISALFILLMCGMVLYETSEIIHGRETNYIMATVSFYVTIYNMFTSLLHILGVFGGDD